MNKNLIFLGPLALIVAGFFWSNYINPGASNYYNFGFGLGIFLIPAIPGLILALVHRSLAKKKAVETNTEVLDGSEPKMKKNSIMFYFSLYTTLLGAILFALMMATK